jgi:putative ABC transport system permease protein
LGYGFAAMMVRGFSSELVRLPLVIDRRTFAYAALAVLATASVTLWRVARGLDHVDLVAALKQRE